MKGPKGGGVHEVHEPFATVCSVESPAIRIIKVSSNLTPSSLNSFESTEDFSSSGDGWTVIKRWNDECALNEATKLRNTVATSSPFSSATIPGLTLEAKVTKDSDRRNGGGEGHQERNCWTIHR